MKSLKTLANNLKYNISKSLIYRIAFLIIIKFILPLSYKLNLVSSIIS